MVESAKAFVCLWVPVDLVSSISHQKQKLRNRPDSRVVVVILICPVKKNIAKRQLHLNARILSSCLVSFFLKIVENGIIADIRKRKLFVEMRERFTLFFSFFVPFGMEKRLARRD